MHGIAGLMMIARAAKPKMPRIVPLPNRWAPDVVTTSAPRPELPERDEFGLATAVFGHAPRLSRQYIAKALEFLRLPKTISPTALFGPGAGTIPELATFGYLLSKGYYYQSHGPKGFFFQSFALGGRDTPGGAVVDFVVWIVTGKRIGVNVDSVYHSPENPFAPGQKLESDRRRNVRLLSEGGYAAIMSVNLRSWGYPLENGPDDLVAMDLARIEFAA